MKIGISFNGVIADVRSLESVVAFQQFGVRRPPGAFVKERLLKEGVFTPEQYAKFKTHVYYTCASNLQLQPIKGVLEYLPLLTDLDHEITVVASEGEPRAIYVYDWLSKQGFELKVVSVEHTNRIAVIARGLDLFVSEDIHQLRQLVGVVPDRFLFSSSYNIDVETGTIAERLFSWKDFYNLITYKTKDST